MVRKDLLKKRRKELRLSRRALGELVECGWQTIQRLEAGVTGRPDGILIRDIEKVLGLRKGELID